MMKTIIMMMPISNVYEAQSDCYAENDYDTGVKEIHIITITRNPGT